MNKSEEKNAPRKSESTSDNKGQQQQQEKKKQQAEHAPKQSTLATDENKS